MQTLTKSISWDTFYKKLKRVRLASSLKKQEYSIFKTAVHFWLSSFTANSYYIAVLWIIFFFLKIVINISMDTHWKAKKDTSVCATHEHKCQEAVKNQTV